MGFHIATPGIEFLFQRQRLVRHFVGQIIFFADVLLEIVKLQVPVLIKLNQLVVALTNDPARFAALVGIVRIVPKKRVALETAGLTLHKVTTNGHCVFLPVGG